MLLSQGGEVCVQAACACATLLLAGWLLALAKQRSSGALGVW
jgi:hypothetical protein